MCKTSYLTGLQAGRNEAKEKNEKVLLALHTMGCALADHNHTWTEEDRHIYETALAAMGDSEPENHA